MAITRAGLAKKWQSAPAIAKDLGIAFAVACVYFPCVLSFKIVLPTFIDWMFGVGGDLSGYYVSLAYYRNSEWFFPLSRFDTLLYPIGTSVVMTDSIPLLAIPTKLISRILPRDFQYYGAWLFTCVWLLALFARRTLSLFVQSPAVHWMGTLLITASLPLVDRFFHIALSAHWLLLAAFYVVLAPRTRFPTFAVCALVLIAEATHPYLFVMVSALLLPALWVHRRLPGAPIGFAAFCWLPILAAWILGYFHVAQTESVGYGGYLSDLSSLFNPMSSSSLVPELPVGRGAYEGFAYLGLGGMTLVFALGARVLRGGLRARSGVLLLAVVCCAMALYAVTGSPQFLGKELFTIPVVADVFQVIGRTFRATGRFMWPLYYALLVFGAAALDQLLRTPLLRHSIATLVFGVQVADIGPWIWAHGRDPGLTAKAAYAKVGLEVTAQLSDASELLILLPPAIDARCPQFGPRPWREWSHLALFGAHHRLKTNSDFSAIARMGAAERRAICYFTARMRRRRARHPEAIFASP